MSVSPVSSPEEGRNLSQYLADAVARCSPVTFGVMGNGNAHFVGALTQQSHPFIKARHEAGAMSMAQGYYLATARIAAATTTYGPGFTNSLTVLSEARIARTPLVLITGAPPVPPRDFDVDQSTVLEGLGVPSLTVARQNFASIIPKAFAQAAQELLPVVVLLPYDLAEESVHEEDSASLPQATQEWPEPEVQAVAEIGQVLSAAKRPLILTGRGAHLSGAAGVIKDLGDKVSALFATSVMARNLTGSEWDCGIAGGFATPGAVRIMRRADVVLALGASLNHFQLRYGTLFPEAARIIQVDIKSAASSPVVTDFLQADARAFAETLLPHLSGRTAGWRDEVPEVADGSVHEEQNLPELGTDGRLNPRAVTIRIDQMLPPDRTIVQDGGHFLGWFAMYGKAPDPHALLHPGLAFHSIGMGFPTAVGAALGRPERLPVLICGDGGGMMTLPDLETLIREVPRALVVVYNDSAYGMEVHQYAVRGIDDEAMIFRDIDFADIARAMGAAATRIQRLQDLDVLAEWLQSESSGVLLLDVRISTEFVAEYVSEKVAAESGG